MDNKSFRNVPEKIRFTPWTQATDESGSDSDGGSSSSSFSSLSELGVNKEKPEIADQNQSEEVTRTMKISNLDQSSVYDPPKSLQVSVYHFDFLNTSRDRKHLK